MNKLNKKKKTLNDNNVMKIMMYYEQTKTKKIYNLAHTKFKIQRYELNITSSKAKTFY